MANRGRDTWRESNNDEELRSWDRFHHARTVISSTHRMIHEGFMFDASGIVASLANGANFDLLFRFPAGEFGHMTVVEYSLGDTPVTISFHEGVTTSADGAAVNIRNHNRVNANDASTVAMTSGPTVTDLGTTLHERFIPDTGGPPGQGGGLLVSGEDDEWVLGDPSAETTYLWRLTNDTGAAIKLGFHFNGYQVGYVD